MLGLAILFGFGLWFLLTFLSTLIGAKIGRAFYPEKGGKVGGCIGFMLLMGWLIVYWIWEFAYVQIRMVQLCHTEARNIVYVSPEEWRKEIGEEEWASLSPYNIVENTDYPRGLSMIFNNKKYYLDDYINQRIVQFTISKRNKYHHISMVDFFFYDIKKKRILYYLKDFYVITPSNISLENLKFWFNYGVLECDFGKQPRLMSFDYWPSAYRTPYRLSN